jgi:GntP family gluconate:H+ symporter
MNPLLIALIGMVIVVSGILALRMHAFLALILAAFCVSILTSQQKVLEYSLNTYAIEILEADGDLVNLKGKPIEGRSSILRENSQGLLEVIGSGDIALTDSQGDGDLVNARLSISGSETSFQASDRIIHNTQLAAANKESNKNWGQRIADGLGSTLTKIALLIAMASIIGKCLMDSGGAERIVLSIAKAVGEKRLPLAFIGSGFTLSIPVFFDTVFYLLIPLGKAMRVKTGKNYLLYVLTIIAGGTMAHSASRSE